MAKLHAESKRGPKRTSRNERMTTRQNLKLMARGNPHRDEVMAAEADLAEAMMDDYRYFQDAERDWSEYEGWNEFERETQRHFYREHYPDTDDDGWDDDWFDERAHDPEPRPPLYADEEAWGLKYSHVDEDDSLMR